MTDPVRARGSWMALVGLCLTCLVADEIVTKAPPRRCRASDREEIQRKAADHRGGGPRYVLASILGNLQNALSK
ncbi:MAG TPA: hypothetical protein VG860_02545 [Terriglobia bacterium]|nr:hypothetical protein [Terriglobia bacterium]